MNPNRHKFAAWIRQKRKDAGLTIRDASLLLGYRSKSALKRIECGYEPIGIKRILALSESYGIDMDELLKKMDEYEPRQAREFREMSEVFARYHLKLLGDITPRVKTGARRASDTERPGERALHHRAARRGIIYYQNQKKPKYHMVQLTEANSTPKPITSRALMEVISHVAHRRNTILCAA